ncbi:MAG: PH domain-containing protein [Pirellulales bacterium]
MNENPERWYSSKVDWWLAPLLCLPPLSSVIVIAASAYNGRWDAFGIGIVVAFFVAALYIGLLFPIRYGLASDRLTVRFGLCRQHIDFAKIQEVAPTNNPLSSPALSLDRLRIQFGPGMLDAVMISPAQRDQFLDELAYLAQLHREGDRLVRRAGADEDHSAST